MQNRKDKRKAAETRQGRYNILSLEGRIKLVKSRGGSKKELGKLQAAMLLLTHV